MIYQGLLKNSLTHKAPLQVSLEDEVDMAWKIVVVGLGCPVLV